MTHVLSQNKTETPTKKIVILFKIRIMLTKEKIKKAIDLLPDNVAVDELIDRIILLDKIEQGLNDVENGNTYTTEQVENKLNKWLK